MSLANQDSIHTVEEVEELKMKLAQEGIEFVSRYSFWAIFRSEQDFKLYKEKEERIFEKIFHPMPIGAILSALFCIFCLWLSIKVYPGKRRICKLKEHEM